MSKDTNKELQRRDAMPFPFRWFTSLIELSDADLRQMLFAIGEYAKSGEVPNFTGALKALWSEYSERIDFDQRKYEETCQRNRDNGKKGAEYGKLGGRPKKTPKTPNGDYKTPDGF